MWCDVPPPPPPPRVQRYAALGLANLALAPRTHAALMTRPAMAALVGVSTSPDIETRRCVAFAFNNLCVRTPPWCDVRGGDVM